MVSPRLDEIEPSRSKEAVSTEHRRTQNQENQPNPGVSRQRPRSKEKGYFEHDATGPADRKGSVDDPWKVQAL